MTYLLNNNGWIVFAAKSYAEDLISSTSEYDLIAK